MLVLLAALCYGQRLSYCPSLPPDVFAELYSDRSLRFAGPFVKCLIIALAQYWSPHLPAILDVVMVNLDCLHQPIVNCCDRGIMFSILENFAYESAPRLKGKEESEQRECSPGCSRSNLVISPRFRCSWLAEGSSMTGATVTNSTMLQPYARRSPRYP